MLFKSVAEFLFKSIAEFIFKSMEEQGLLTV